MRSDRVEAGGAKVTVRMEKGRDIDAACGRSVYGRKRTVCRVHLARISRIQNEVLPLNALCLSSFHNMNLNKLSSPSHY